jgi:hypothetical protein
MTDDLIAEEGDGLTTAEKWQIFSIVTGTVLSVAYILWVASELSEGKGGGPLYRMRWKLDQAKRRRAAEVEFQKAKAHVLYEAWEVVTSANA